MNKTFAPSVSLPNFLSFEVLYWHYCTLALITPDKYSNAMTITMIINKIAAAVSYSYLSNAVFSVAPIPPAPTNPRIALSRKLMSSL